MIVNHIATLCRLECLLKPIPAVIHTKPAHTLIIAHADTTHCAAAKTDWTVDVAPWSRFLFFSSVCVAISGFG